MNLNELIRELQEMRRKHGGYVQVEVEQIPMPCDHCGEDTPGENDELEWFFIESLTFRPNGNGRVLIRIEESE